MSGPTIDTSAFLAAPLCASVVELESCAGVYLHDAGEPWLYSRLRLNCADKAYAQRLAAAINAAAVVPEPAPEAAPAA